jgi:prepilin peptidase CpaA
MTIFPGIVIGVCALWAAFTDVAKFKVYNHLTIPCFFGGLIYGTIAHGFSGLLYALAGAVLGLCILILPYLMGGLGAGDVKFVMAVGTWLGPVLLLPAIIIGCLAIGVYSLFLIGRQGGLQSTLMNFRLLAMRLSTIGRHLALDDEFESVQAVAKQDGRRGRLIPFSAMISIGIIAAIVYAWTSGVGLTGRQ